MNRPVTPEDQKVIDEINCMIYGAWKLWRRRFNRTPDEAAELMIKAIKDHQEWDIQKMKTAPANENPPDES